MATLSIDAEPYAVPRTGAPIDLHLDANEGPRPAVDLRALLDDLEPGAVRRYPSAADVEREIAAGLGVAPARVIVTAGGDDAIDRACRVALAPGRELLLPTPTFEMIARFARAAGAAVREVPWPAGAPYPVAELLRMRSAATAMVALVSPNNPTGAVASSADLARLAEGFPSALILADLAYAEFADEDLTPLALAQPNVVAVRTFSKAFGLAGLRVGYAVGPERFIRAMRAVGSPFPVSSVGVIAARAALRASPSLLPGIALRVREERAALTETLRAVGAGPAPSQANFVLAEFPDADWAWRALGSLGIAVRRCTQPGLERALRITCPGEPTGFARLEQALRAALAPRALLLDMDGVLADVSGSYREAIVGAAASFGVRLSRADVAAAKARPDANNDWIVTHRLIADAGVRSTLADVTARFEALYHGCDATPGLERSESLIPSRNTLERLRRRVPLAIVTGRPRRDCERFLRRFDLDGLFDAVVCMEDAPRKPDPAPVRLALRRLGVEHAWMVGDTPDDVVASRLAGVVPIGVPAPGPDAAASRDALLAAGAARVLSSLESLEAMLP